ncbi:MAG: hypothetical protein AABX10_01285 [Nanoarchaeota archaeon]
MDILFNKILDIHKTQLNYLNISHKKLLICFSAIPAAGKTHISKILEEKYKAVRINNNSIREIIKSIIPGTKNEILDKRQEILQDYLLWFLNNYSFLNKLIIIDSGIDRKYSKIKEFADKNDFDLFLIHLKVSREVAYKRAILRNGGKEDSNFTQNIERWIKENKKLLSNVLPDILLDGENLKLEELFSNLNRIIS